MDKFYTPYEISHMSRNFPEHIPIVFICKTLGKSFKFMLEKTYEIGRFNSIMHKKLGVDMCKSLILFSCDRIIGSSGTMGMLYQLYKNKDGFVTIYGELESVFG
jgi:hypothetical protein